MNGKALVSPLADAREMRFIAILMYEEAVRVIERCRLTKTKLEAQKEALHADCARTHVSRVLQEPAANSRNLQALDQVLRELIEVGWKMEELSGHIRQQVESLARHGPGATCNPNQTAVGCAAH